MHHPVRHLADNLGDHERQPIATNTIFPATTLLPAVAFNYIPSNSILYRFLLLFLMKSMTRCALHDAVIAPIFMQQANEPTAQPVYRWPKAYALRVLNGTRSIERRGEHSAADGE